LTYLFTAMSVIFLSANITRITQCSNIILYKRHGSETHKSAQFTAIPVLHDLLITYTKHMLTI